MIYENKNLVNSDEEFEQTVIQFRGIYDVCSSEESEVELIEYDYRCKIIKERMEIILQNDPHIHYLWNLEFLLLYIPCIVGLLCIPYHW